jgi:hypothetical protein
MSQHQSKLKLQKKVKKNQRNHKLTKRKKKRLMRMEIQ